VVGKVESVPEAPKVPLNCRASSTSEITEFNAPSIIFCCSVEKVRNALHLDPSQRQANSPFV
jgi:hypothetical protein